MKPSYALILATLTALFSFSASASTSCDCSQLLEQCGASVKRAGSDIQIRTNTQRCAQVTWYTDDVAHNTIVVNGKKSKPSKLKSSKSFLSVGSCNICANTQLTSANKGNPNESAECRKRKSNLKLSEKYYTQGRITPYEYQLSKDMVKKHCK